MENTSEKINFLNNEMLKIYQGSIRLVFKDGKYEFNKSDLSNFEAITIIMIICEIIFVNNKLKGKDSELFMLYSEMETFMIQMQKEMERR